MFESVPTADRESAEEAAGDRPGETVAPRRPRPGGDRHAERLRRHGLRPTRQRIDLARVLYGRGDRHVSAEVVYGEALAAGVSVSLATVYNTLKQFTEAGLLRELAVSGAKTWFDTRVDPHHHFHVEDDDTMIDVPREAVGIAHFPEPPEGMEIVGFDVVVRLRRRR